MNILVILLSVLLVLTFVVLWGLLAMASWSDRQLALAWQNDHDQEAGASTTGMESRA